MRFFRRRHIRLLVPLFLGGALIGAIACGGETIVEKVVVQTVIVETEKVVREQVVETVIVEKIVEVAPTKKGGEFIFATVFVPPPLYIPSAQPSPEYWKPHAWGITETPIRTDWVDPPGFGLPGATGLITGWEFNADNTKLTFKVRDGVTFHGGGKDWGPMTAEDLVFTFTDAGKEGSRAARAGSFNADNGRGFWDCSASDKNTFSCTVGPKLSATWAYNISNEVGLLGVHSKRVFDELGEDKAILTPHGTGPWDVVKQIANDELIANAVTDHWRAPPKEARLHIIQIKEPAAAVAALETGEVDLAQIPSSLVLDAEKASGGKRRQINKGLGGQNVFFGGNFWAKKHFETGEPLEPREGFKPDKDHPWIGDPDDPANFENARKVRNALALAIDRPLLNETVLDGLGKPIYTQGGYEKDTPYWKEEWFIPFDPAAGKALLAEAGYPNGFKMGFWVPSDSPFVNPEVGIAVAEMWRDIGVNVQIENTAYSARRPTLVARSIDIPWLFINQASGGPEARKMSRWFPFPGWNSGGELNETDLEWGETGWHGLKGDENRQARIDLGIRVEDFVHNLMIAVPVVELVKYYIQGPRVVEWTPYRHNENGPNSFETIVLK